MKIDLDKAFLLIVPFLFIVSAAYYQGYWVAFNTDVYSYLDASDIIKGVGRPAFEAAAAAVILSLSEIARPFFVFLEDSIEAKWGKKIIESVKDSLSSIFIVVVYAVLFPGKFDFAIAFVFFVASILALVLLKFYQSLTDDDNYNRAHAAILLVVLLWPAIVYMKGKYNSDSILTNEKFDYTLLKNNSNTKNQVFKFIGKAGSHYFFVSLDNKDKIVVDMSEMKRLDLIEYNVHEPKALNRFREVLRTIN